MRYYECKNSNRVLGGDRELSKKEFFLSCQIALSDLEDRDSFIKTQWEETYPDNPYPSTLVNNILAETRELTPEEEQKYINMAEKFVLAIQAFLESNKKSANIQYSGEFIEFLETDNNKENLLKNLPEGIEEFSPQILLRDFVINLPKLIPNTKNQQIKLPSEVIAFKEEGHSGDQPPEPPLGNYPEEREIIIAQESNNKIKIPKYFQSETGLEYFFLLLNDFNQKKHFKPNPPSAHPNSLLN